MNDAAPTTTFEEDTPGTPYRFVQSLRSDRTSAILLLIAAGLGLLVANTAVGPSVIAVQDARFGVPGLELSTGAWIADLLLAIFFFAIAVELRHEFTVGDLATPAKALAPLVAAVFGVAGPALLYIALAGPDLARGWPVPTATDIAFALGVIGVFGRGLPSSLRVFLLAVAVLDDLIGILLIAVVLTSGIAVVPLLIAVVLLAVFWFVARRDGAPLVRGIILLALAIAVWVLVHESGVHATLAGVALGLAIAPARGARVAHATEPWVNAVILPLFAFSAALVVFPSGEGEISPTFHAIAIALPVGKIIGITLGGTLLFLVTRNRDLVRGWDLVALASVAGIGFTVSLLMNELAFRENAAAADAGTLGVLLGSGISLVIGAAMISWRAAHYRKVAAAA